MEEVKNLNEIFAEEFWSPINQTLYPNGETCSKIETCADPRKETGYGLLYCEKYPNACELNHIKNLK